MKEPAFEVVVLQSCINMISFIHNKFLEEKSESAATIVCLLKIVCSTLNLALSEIEKTHLVR